LQSDLRGVFFFVLFVGLFIIDEVMMHQDRGGPIKWSRSMELSDLGFDGRFDANIPPSIGEERSLARVTAVDRGSYLVRNERSEVPAELSGKLSYLTGNPAELPCVGDWVEVRYYDDGRAAIVHQVFPRRSFLRRKSAGDGVDFQMIAANVDTAFIIQSCHFDFNPRRLERYLVMAADGRVEPVVVLTKTDLISGEELQEKLGIVGSLTDADVLGISNVTGAGIEEFRRRLSPGRTCCLLGSSGVGKTTLVNLLLGREAFDTKCVSGTGEGIHTTTRRQLVLLAEGAMLIDTPGMRELGLMGAGEGVALGFEEIACRSAECRYADCRHENEPGCAVRSAVESGELDGDRYASYLKLRKELEYNELSYLEKRQKDKAFGRFVKAAKKRMNDR
jgi:ribosome biogenesis GTPase